MYLHSIAFGYDDNVRVKATGQRGIVTQIRFECEDGQVVAIYEVDVKLVLPLELQDFRVDELERWRK